MTYIVFENIEKYYGENHVLKNTNLSIHKGEFVTLLGSSGCGKSTLLRCLAGLEGVTSGKIFLDGEDITFWNPKDRNIGMIFQQYSLFPNMNVYNNISFGLRMKKVKKDTIDDLVKNTLKIVDLQGYEKRYPYQLSGGEQQRVALARCIVTKPKVLLLDEPLSAVDAKLRKSLQARIKEIHRELNMTSIFVTHDQDEAMTMSDTIHIMRDGIIEQSGTPFEIYSNPRSIFAASFVGNYNILEKDQFSKLINQEYSTYSKIVIRPETIEISHVELESCKDSYSISGKIIDILPQGNIIRYTVDINSVSLKVDVLFNDLELYALGQEVYLKLKKNHCIGL
ncbi:ABC transporter ATP-binding protein [uncultured Tissierella sp.]|uniref:ABC transporter ATP-binding protein n=1 Tax=uncultured Tissierella sp. TaxID=448160 RepID=UPI002806458E|nr:ABC transporter ATP-binding protein [uncultured Tissierella sp.]MDU5080490.1 ABC transporter ATP-binding protein [Bacillota bacterium]